MKTPFHIGYENTFSHNMKKCFREIRLSNQINSLNILKLMGQHFATATCCPRLKIFKRQNHKGKSNEYH